MTFFIVLIGTLQTRIGVVLPSVGAACEGDQRGEVVVAVGVAERGQVVRPKVGVSRPGFSSEIHPMVVI